MFRPMINSPLTYYIKGSKKKKVEKGHEQASTSTSFAYSYHISGQMINHNEQVTILQQPSKETAKWKGGGG